MQNLIEVSHVGKSFGELRACDDISLVIPRGSIYGLLGPNGAGKTTLIRMITTITRPDSGTILYNGEPLSGDHASRMGYMPEERGLYKKMTVINQLLFFAELKGMKRSDAQQQARFWLQRLDMVSWVNKRLEELSKGMAQKVQFLATILHRPELLVLDEPFSGFDPVNADLIKDMIIELNKQGTTILFSTHRMDNVEELCKYLCIIDHGKKVLDGEAGGMRRRMYDNSYEIGFLQEKLFDGAAMPSRAYDTADGRHMYVFNSSPDMNPDDLLKMAMAKGDMVYFAEALPTIHQIFVNTVSHE